MGLDVESLTHNDIVEYLERLKNLYKNQVYDENHPTKLSSDDSLISSHEIIGLLTFNHPDIRSGKLSFNEVDGKDINKYFLHTTRPHPLREMVIKSPSNTFTGDNFNLEEAKRLAWVDHDIPNGFSGYLVFLIHSSTTICGGIIGIDTIQSEFRYFFANAVWCAEALTECHVMSLLIHPSDVDTHQQLIQRGLHTLEELDATRS